ncbi:MAG: hypothetical protein N2235_19535 [Fischerella sp.]|nr:hypothetical protein [Fischerella sp.]
MLTVEQPEFSPVSPTTLPLLLGVHRVVDTGAGATKFAFALAEVDGVGQVLGDDCQCRNELLWHPIVGFV